MSVYTYDIQFASNTYRKESPSLKEKTLMMHRTLKIPYDNLVHNIFVL